MRVYLDNCCYNRPFDDQTQLKVLLESLAKLAIQQKMREGELEYVWSTVLDFEIGKSKFVDRVMQILPWANGAVTRVFVDDAIRQRAKCFESVGVKPADALHVACAESADCDWFFTTDNGLIKKAKAYTSMRVANPVEFFGGD